MRRILASWVCVVLFHQATGQPRKSDPSTQAFVQGLVRLFPWPNLIPFSSSGCFKRIAEGTALFGEPNFNGKYGIESDYMNSDSIIEDPTTYSLLPPREDSTTKMMAFYQDILGKAIKSVWIREMSFLWNKSIFVRVAIATLLRGRSAIKIPHLSREPSILEEIFFGKTLTRLVSDTGAFAEWLESERLQVGDNTIPRAYTMPQAEDRRFPELAALLQTLKLIPVVAEIVDKHGDIKPGSAILLLRELLNDTSPRQYAAEREKAFVTFYKSITKVKSASRASSQAKLGVRGFTRKIGDTIGGDFNSKIVVIDADWEEETLDEDVRGLLVGKERGREVAGADAVIISLDKPKSKPRNKNTRARIPQLPQWASGGIELTSLKKDIWANLPQSVGDGFELASLTCLGEEWFDFHTFILESPGRVVQCTAEICVNDFATSLQDLGVENCALQFVLYRKTSRREWNAGGRAYRNNEGSPVAPSSRFVINAGRLD